MSHAPCFVELAETDSTNAEAMRRALAGERGPLYIRADRQTAGRGRSGRAWQSASGNLAMSRLGVVAAPPAAVAQVALVTGLAVHRALATLLDAARAAAPLHLKWPNDVLLGQAKVAGILVEGSTLGAERVVVIGIGVNIAAAPELGDRPATALARHLGMPPPPGMLGRLIAAQLESALELWNDGAGFAEVRQEWLVRAMPLGTPMAVNSGSTGQVSGRFAGLDSAGYLLIELGQGSHCVVTAGDVALIGG